MSRETKILGFRVVHVFEVIRIGFTVIRTTKQVVDMTPMVPTRSFVEPPRQLSFNLDLEQVEKPALKNVHLLINTMLDAHQPDLELAPVRVSSRMTRTIGSYMPSKKQLAISSRLLAMGDEKEIRQVVLHEIAHAIVHARFGEKPKAHGKEFRAICIELGVDPSRHVDVDTEKWKLRIRYLVKCGHCKMIVIRNRRTRSVRCLCGSKIYPKSWRAVVPAGSDPKKDWLAV